MPPLRRAASGSSGGGDLALLGNSDAAAAINGVYLVDDLMGQTPCVTSGILSGSGGGGYSYGTPGGVPTIPSGWAVGDFAARPGVLTFNTSALNDVGGFQLGAAAFHIQNAGSAGFKWTAILAPPQVVSSAGDRYQMVVGPLLASATGPVHGWGVSYTDNAGSGQYQLIEYQSATMSPQVICTVGIGASAKQWVLVTISIVGVAMTLSVLPLGTTTTYAATGNSYLLNASANNGIAMPVLGAWMKRLTFTSGVHCAFVDRVALSITNLGRK